MTEIAGNQNVCSTSIIFILILAIWFSFVQTDLVNYSVYDLFENKDPSFSEDVGSEVPEGLSSWEWNDF